MPVEIRVPTLGESVVEATVTRWFKKEGDSVALDEPLVELETDKVNLEVPAEKAGTVQQILATEGQTVSVGAPLCVIGDAKEAPPAPNHGGAGTEEAAPPLPDKPAENLRNGEGALDNADLAATPLARSFAEENKVDLRLVKGTGPGGKVSRDDVAGFISQGKEAPSTAAAPPAPNNGGAGKVALPSAPSRPTASPSSPGPALLGAGGLRPAPKSASK